MFWVNDGRRRRRRRRVIVAPRAAPPLAASSQKYADQLQIGSIHIALGAFSYIFVSNRGLKKDGEGSTVL